jgi:hypothetical protein
MMDKSESLNELALALAKAQGEMKPALKDADNPYFKSKYADIASVWEACREPLANNGLSIVQLPEPADNAILLTTILLHSSGQYLSSQLRFPIAKTDPQSYGSALTYARRYALAAAVGVYQDDDDGNEASNKDAKQGNNNRAGNKQSTTTPPNSPNTQRNNTPSTNTTASQQNTPISQNEQAVIRWDTFYGNVKNLGLDEQKVKEIASAHYGKPVASLKDVISTQQELNQFLSVVSKHRQQPKAEESLAEKRKRLMEKMDGYDHD